jgi:hypothetical protein
MKLTYLNDLESSRDVVAMATIKYGNSWHKVVSLFTRSPNADELVLVSDELARFDYCIDESLSYDFSLKSLGVHPLHTSFLVCSRTDCGLFWRGVAMVKYKILLGSYWLRNQMLRCLYSLGMLEWRRYEEIDFRKSIRLDWLLITLVIATLGITVCGAYLLHDEIWFQSLFCFWVNFFGWLSIGQRRKHLVAVRDRKMLEADLHGFFQRHRITPTEDEFARCMLGILEPNEVVSMHRATQAVHRAESELTHPCAYYSNSCHMRCAVHPYHPSEGKCNAECPSFTPKDNQRKT